MTLVALKTYRIYFMEQNVLDISILLTDVPTIRCMPVSYTHLHVTGDGPAGRTGRQTKTGE